MYCQGLLLCAYNCKQCCNMEGGTYHDIVLFHYSGSGVCRSKKQTQTYTTVQQMYVFVGIVFVQTSRMTSYRLCMC